MTVRVVRVLPDVPAIDKTFDYLVPAALDQQVQLGVLVRVELHGRRVGGWVVADGVDPPPDVDLRPLAKVTGWGPPPAVFDLAGWAAWRWAGRPASLLRTASPDRAVPRLPGSGRPAPGAAGSDETADDPVSDLARQAAEDGGPRVLRIPPASSPVPVVLSASRAVRVGAGGPGSLLVLSPTAARARWLAGRLEASGAGPVALLPDGWADARAGTAPIVVGARAAAWAPIPALAGVVVLDEHDEVYQEERAPTWHGRDVVVERARRQGVPCLLVSPVPTLEALAIGPLHRLPRGEERAGWPAVEVVDRRQGDPLRAGPISERLADLVRSDARVLCVLNRKGRSRLLACSSCQAIAVCESCDAAVSQDPERRLACPRCGTVRPALCLTCGGTRFKNLRMGVTRLREELEALAGTEVAEVTGEGGDSIDLDAVRRARVVVGTEAVLHRAGRADVVAFIDLDQELLAPRYRAAEQALALVVRGARLVGGRRGSGRLVLQTRSPDHEVVQAAQLGDPDRVAAPELERRRLLGLPPVTALAAVSGAAAPAFVAALGRPLGVEVQGPDDGRWLLRADDHGSLADALAAVPRPPGRLRIEVDPLRL